MPQSVCKYLDLESTELIKSVSPLKLIAKDMIVAYEGQVPTVAVWVNQGTVIIKNKISEVKEIIQTGPILLFLDQVLNTEISNVSIEIKKGAEVSILDRPMLKKITPLN